MSGWIRDIDLDTKMLRCPYCQGRVVEDRYRDAVGDAARYCPYCGTDLGVFLGQMIIEQMSIEEGTP